MKLFSQAYNKFCNVKLCTGFVLPSLQLVKFLGNVFIIIVPCHCPILKINQINPPTIKSTSENSIHWCKLDLSETKLESNFKSLVP